MRIVDRETEHVLNVIQLTLTPNEARQMLDTLTDLLNAPQKGHGHVSTSDYQTEVTVQVEREAGRPTG